MRQSRGRGSKVETEARPCEAEARPSQLKKTASRPPRAEADASRTASLSTIQAVMEIIDNIYQHCDNNEITVGIYIHLQKAFDTVDHLILLKKLTYYGIRGIVLD